MFLIKESLKQSKERRERFVKFLKLIKEGKIVESLKSLSLKSLSLKSLIPSSLRNSIWFSNEGQKDIDNFIEQTKGRIKVVDTSIIQQLISKNELKIIQFDKDKLHDLVRLSNFVQNLESTIKKKFEYQIAPENIYQSQVLAYLELEKNMKHLDGITKLSVTLINKILEEKRTEFLIIYEKFEDIGVFRSSFEHELLNKFDKLSNQLNDISGKLSSISGKIGYQNLLLTYNTYQFSKYLKK